jgi:hypothetical protein
MVSPLSDIATCKPFRPSLASRALGSGYCYKVFYEVNLHVAKVYHTLNLYSELARQHLLAGRVNGQSIAGVGLKLTTGKSSESVVHPGAAYSIIRQLQLYVY